MFASIFLDIIRNIVIQCVGGGVGMSKLIKSITTLFILIAVAIMSIGGFYLYNKNNANSQMTETTVDTTQESTIETTVEQGPEYPSLLGKSILTIGDSITWLDGNKIKDVGLITGYQQVLREEGATVFAYGNSGGTYRLYNEKSTRQHRSIYKEIVEGKLINFSNLDIITLFGGTNDVGAGKNFGTPVSKDPNETLGALNLLIDYLKTQNPDAIIFLCSPIYSSKENRTEKNMEELNQGLSEVAVLKGIEYVDMYHDFDINKDTSAEFLYDGLHPNSLGMRAIGERMKSVIEKKLSEENEVVISN